MKSLCVVLVNYNNAQDTIECLDSLEQCRSFAALVCLVDNHSKDDSSFWLQQKISSSNLNIKFVQSKVNHGFGAGCNLGIQEGERHQCDYFILLNNDTVVSEGFMENFLGLDPSFYNGIVGSQILDYYSDRNLVSAGIVNKENFLVEFVECVKPQKSKEVDFVSGCFMGIPKEVIQKIGYLSEKFFLYYEDVEYCLRAKKFSIPVVMVPELGVQHKENATVKKESVPYFYYGVRNNAYLVKKYGSYQQKIAFLGVHLKTMILNLPKVKQNWAIIKANCCGFMGIMGR